LWSSIEPDGGDISCSFSIIETAIKYCTEAIHFKMPILTKAPKIIETTPILLLPLQLVEAETKRNTPKKINPTLQIPNRREIHLTVLSLANNPMDRSIVHGEIETEKKRGKKTELQRIERMLLSFS
jgi:hypothetical protein